MLDTLFGPELEVVVVAAPLLFLASEEEEEEDFLFLFLCVALTTVSLYGNTIWDGVATTMLVSVLQLAAIFLAFSLEDPCIGKVTLVN